MLSQAPSPAAPRELARVLADSISPDGVRLTTLLVRMPRIVLAEFNTHRMLSKSSASSRAIPIETMLRRVIDDPYIPEQWGQNGKGMQAHGAVSDDAAEAALSCWLSARDHAVEHAKALAAIGIHKQTANRLLEPFAWHEVICTATEWSNFFNLRCNPLAHPAIRLTAEAMRDVISERVPTQLGYDDWHLPLVDPIRDKGLSVFDRIKVSTARCARVSYLTHEGVRDPTKDSELHDALVTNGHMCYDDKTEVLTAQGWKAWPAVQVTDRLCAVDIVTGACKYELPQALHSYEVDEDLYHVYGQQLDLKVTQNHRMVTSRRCSGNVWTPFAFEPASDVVGNGRRYLKSARLHDSTVSVHVPFDEVARASFFRFLGFFIGDGYSSGGNQALFHIRKQRKIDFLRSLNLPLKEYANGKFSVTLPKLGVWCDANCYDDKREKVLPAWVLGLNATDAQHVLEGLKASDGTLKRKTWVYTTTSVQVADMLQALLHTHGLVGCLSSQPYGDQGVVYRINVSTRISPRVEVNHAGRSRTYAEECVRYRGRVYCATTSTGALMVRRNGNVAVSGNSPLEHVARPMTSDDPFPVTSDLVFTVGEGGASSCKPGPEKRFAGNFNGWVQFRKTVPHEADILAARTPEVSP